jgi:hypothetical protein
LAEQNRQTARSKSPISRHPLFPAIIALWFGAVFGLGSLAVRPSLLEEMVLSAHIDTLIPAAAPPLGMTSRILLALAMALIGGMIGGTIARRIARPKPEFRQRRRGAAAVGEAATSYAGGRFQASFEDDDEDELATPLPANKRRSLAMSEEEAPLELHEFAPLPGGPPQILNMADVAVEPIRSHTSARDREDAGFAPVAPAASETPAPHEAMARLEQTFGASAMPASPRFAAPSEASGHRSFDGPTPVASAIAPAPFSAPVQTAQAAMPVAPAPIVPPAAPAPVTELAARPFAAPSAPPPAIPAEAPAICATEEPREALALGSHVPLFAPRPAAARGVIAPETVTPETGTPETVTDEAIAEPVAFAPEPAPMAPVEAAIQAEASAAFAPPAGAAAQRIVAADLDTLSPVQLVERLALSIQRRRDRAVEAPVAAVEPLVAAPRIEAIAPSVVAVGTDPAPAAAGRLPEVVTPSFGADVVPVPMPMPAALRPISLDDDDETDFADFLPPRRIGLAESAAIPAPVMPSAPSESVAAACEDDAEAEADADTGDLGAEPDDDTRALEDGYSSLLDLSRPVAARQQFVRIEDPEDNPSSVEPVVVFPGQVARLNGQAPETKPVQTVTSTPPAVPQTGGFRRFDSPPAGTSGARPAAQQDPAEAERALRAALATLQRMSAAS